MDVIRRPTGGRAVHDNEVTYSFIISEDDPLLPPDRDSFIWLQGDSEGLLSLNSLKFRAGKVQEAWLTLIGRNHEPVARRIKAFSRGVFDSPSWYEVVRQQEAGG